MDTGFTPIQSSTNKFGIDIQQWLQNMLSPKAIANQFTDSRQAFSSLGEANNGAQDFSGIGGDLSGFAPLAGQSNFSADTLGGVGQNNQFRMDIDNSTGKPYGNGEEGGGFLDWFKGGDGNFDFDKLGKIASFGSDLMGAYTGWKGLGLAEDAFSHQKGLDQANLNNQIALLESNMQDTNAARSRRASNNGIDPSQVNLLQADFTTLGGKNRNSV